MTYTTEKILANFLDNEDGLLSKKFIETATLFFGQSLAKRAFIESVRRCDYVRDFLSKPTIVLLQGHSYNTVIDVSQRWRPGTVDRFQQGTDVEAAQSRMFSIYRFTPYASDEIPYVNFDHTVIDHIVREHMIESLTDEEHQMIQEGKLPPIPPLSNAFSSSSYAASGSVRLTSQLSRELLYETLYDKVAAQGYNGAADAESLREYFMSLMHGNDLFKWSKWVGEGGLMCRYPSTSSQLVVAAS